MNRKFSILSYKQREEDSMEASKGDNLVKEDENATHEQQVR